VQIDILIINVPYHALKNFNSFSSPLRDCYNILRVLPQARQQPAVREPTKPST